MTITFEDLQPNQMCTYIYTEELESDVVIAIRTPSGSLQDIYSAKDVTLRRVSLESELVKRRYSFVSAGEIMYIDLNDYPELLI